MVTYEQINKLVKEDHWGKGKSLRRIERENGLSNDTIRKFCIKHGIKTKTRKQSIIDNQSFIDMPAGKDHWSKKNPDRHAECRAESSKRMKANNPSHNIETVKKTRDTLSKTYIDNPTPHEKLFASILDSLNIEYTSQKRVLTYNPDFIICNTIIELDGRGHAGRAAKDAVRDQLLCESGFNVIRIDQDGLWNKRKFPDTVKPRKLLSVMEKYIPDLDVSGLDPSFVFGKYRVLVREANTGTEIIY